MNENEKLDMFYVNFIKFPSILQNKVYDIYNYFVN